jgi:MtN3 and saliva related transmembrane protein
VQATTVLGVATTAWGVVMSVAPILQIRRIRAAQSSASVSTGHLMVLLVGFSLWLAYGFAIDLKPLIITNAVSLLATTAWLVEVYRHRPAAYALGGGPT